MLVFLWILPSQADFGGKTVDPLALRRLRVECEVIPALGSVSLQMA
jgi:hypothetical protein